MYIRAVKREAGYMFLVDWSWRERRDNVLSVRSDRLLAEVNEKLILARRRANVVDFFWEPPRVEPR